MPGRPSSIRAVHIPNAQMTTVAIQYPAQEFVSERACPRLPVKNESDIYYTFKKSHLNVIDSLKGISALPREIIWEIESEDTYICRRYALREFLPDPIRNNQDPPIKSDITCTEHLLQTFLLSQEKRVRDLYAARDGSGTPPSPKKWDDKDCTNIEDDVDIAVGKVKLAIGMKPNTVIMSDAVKKAIRKNPFLRNLFKYLAIPPEQVFSVEKMFAMVFDIQNVLVAGAVYNSANKGQADILAELWGDTVYVAYLEPRPDLMKASFCYNIFTETRQMTSKRDEDREGTEFKIRNVQIEKAILSAGCEAITDVLA